MIFSIIPFFLTFITLLGIGFLTKTILRKLRIFGEQNLKIEYIFVLGLLSLTSFLAFLSFFVPINFFVKTAIIAFLALFFSLNHRFLQVFRTSNYLDLKKTLALLFFLIFFISSLALPFNYDTGLYHLQAIQWAENQPVVFGLGNLHGRLAFNSHFFLLAAFFNFLSQNFYILNAVLFFAFSVYCLQKFHKPLYFSALFFSFYFYYKWISSPTPDILATLLVFFILLETSEKLKSNSKPIFDSEWFVILSVAFFLLTLKLSNLPILLVFAVFVPSVWNYGLKPILRAKKRIFFFGIFNASSLCRSFDLQKKSIFFFGLFNAFVISLWLGRNLILSGYLVYPFPALDWFGFDWKIPISKVVEEKFLVEIWAKIPPDVSHISRDLPLTFADWFPIWLEARPNSLLEKIMFFGTIILIPFGIYRLINKSQPKAYATISYGIVFGISLGGLLFWFLTAPDFRFAHGFLVMGFVSGVLLVFPFLEQIFEKYHFYFQKTAFIFVLFYLLILLLNFSNTSFFSEISVLKKIKNTIPTNYEKHFWYPEPYPIAVCDTVYTADGFRVFVPKNDPRCWASPQPCTPLQRFDSQVIRRGKSPRSGFRIKSQK